MNVIHSATSSAAVAGDKDASSSTTASRHVLQWYDEVPQLELSLDDFEVYALKRLRVLRKIEQVKMMRGVTADQSRAKLDQWIQQEDLDDPLVDQASHFILRLSYSQSEELRRWFLQMESALFLHRLQQQPQKELAKSVASYAELSPISKAEKEGLRDELLQLLTPSEFANSHFYAVPFVQALDLVATRQCLVKQGKAYIPQAKVYSILMHKFRSHLSRALACMASAGVLASHQNAEQARIFPLLQNLNRCLVHTEPTADAQLLTAGGSQLRAGNVTDFVPHMPLCMQQLHRGMKADGKLRHWGRLQYGLFLKGAGLSLEDAQLFFQRHFTAVTGEVFQKQYAYNIRHMYGKEGKRASYTPYPCTKIILGNAPAAGDHHGCPYKHYDTEHVGRLLQKLQIGTASDRSAILALQKSKQFQLACTKHFEVMHPGAAHQEGVSLDNVGNHPNAWFRASVMYSEKQQQQEAAGGSSGTTTLAVGDAGGDTANVQDEGAHVSP